jgi:hypothetical protein
MKSRGAQAAYLHVRCIRDRWIHMVRRQSIKVLELHERILSVVRRDCLGDCKVHARRSAHPNSALPRQWGLLGACERGR